MKLIVGLGNPGKEYESTRHNIGFMVVDKLSRELNKKGVDFSLSEKHKAMIAKIDDVILVKPQTNVNGSGVAVKSLVSFYKLTSSDVWVVHDDIDLPIGKIRIRERGGSAGHNGIESIIAHLKTDAFVRFRLGVGRGVMSTGQSMKKKWDQRAVIKLVLSPFSRSEAGDLKHLVKHGMEAVQIGLLEGLEKARNQYH